MKYEPLSGREFPRFSGIKTFFRLLHVSVDSNYDVAIAFPFQLRLFFGKDPKIMGEVLKVVNRAISTPLLKKAGFTKKSGSKTGAVTFIQRFGGSLNLNIHFHMMYLDKVHTFD